MLINGSALIHMLNQFRIAWCMGGYGSGKTLVAYQLAYELYMTGRYRYILGNSNSVWTDSPEDVVLRDGSFVDAICILDEGGLFLKYSTDADQFMLGLRKLNITILIPSVLPPSSRVKFLQVQRIFNGYAIGIPAWLYQYRLSLGTEKEKAYALVYKPQQFYGIYDTTDYPIDDLYLSDWFQYWMETARESKSEWAAWGKPPGAEGRKNKMDTRSSGKNQNMVEIGGLVEEVADRQADIEEALSLHAFQATVKRRK